MQRLLMRLSQQARLPLGRRHSAIVHTAYLDNPGLITSGRHSPICRRATGGAGPEASRGGRGGVRGLAARGDSTGVGRAAELVATDLIGALCPNGAPLRSDWRAATNLARMAVLGRLTSNHMPLSSCGALDAVLKWHGMAGACAARSANHTDILHFPARVLAIISSCDSTFKPGIGGLASR